MHRAAMMFSQGVLAMVVAGAAAFAAEDAKPTGPAEQVKSTAEVVQSMKDDHKKGGFLGEGHVDHAECSQRDFKAFVAWHNPYSGQAACRVYVYVYSTRLKLWERKVSGEFENTHDVSVEFGQHRIYIRDVDGKIIYRYPAE